MFDFFRSAKIQKYMHATQSSPPHIGRTAMVACIFGFFYDGWNLNQLKQLKVKCFA